MKGILYFAQATQLTHRLSKSNSLFKTHFKTNNISAIFQNYKYCGIIGNTPLIRFFHGNQDLTQFLINQGIIQPTIISSSRINFTLSVQGAILNYVLQPTQLVLSAMESIFPHYQNQSFIGIHLRTGGYLSDIRDPSQYLNWKHVRSAVSFMKSRQQSNSSLFVFLSSDSSKVKNMTSTTLNSSRLILNNNRVVIVDTQLGTSGQADQLLSAIAELMLLGHSQSCYGTYGSTYSHVGCSLNGKTPWLIGRKKYKLSPVPLSYPYI